MIKDKEKSAQPQSIEEKEKLSPKSRSKLIKLIIDLSEKMLSCGGEVSRIEESVFRICTAYGAEKTDVFCITSVVIITTIWEDGEILTQSRRISQGSRNFARLEQLNGLSRELCEKKPSIEYIEQRLNEIENKKYLSKWLICLGSILAAGGFATFFGGSILDALAGAICGVIIFLIDQFIYNNRMNKVIYHIVCSFVAGAASVLLVRLGLGHNLDKIMIGCIMLLIPGINLTAAVEDVLVGDTATGALRIFEAALLACAIAMGFALAVYVFKGGEVL